MPMIPALSRRTSMIGAPKPSLSLVCAVALLVVVAACSSDSPELSPTAATASDAPAAPVVEIALPERDGPRRQTSESVPHVQLDASPVAGIDAELRRRVFQLPQVTNAASDRSLPGARGLMLAPNLELARPGAIAGSQEFAHIHPDGSLHVWLPTERAIEADRLGWGDLHPWVDRNGFWDGVVLIFTPETVEELETVIQLVVDGYNFVVGTDLTPDDIP